MTLTRRSFCDGDMRGRFCFLALCGIAVLAAGCGAGGKPASTPNLNARSGGGPGPGFRPPVPSFTPPAPTLGDACLVGSWSLTSGTWNWFDQTYVVNGGSRQLGPFFVYETLTGGSGAQLSISYNGTSSLDFDGSKLYQLSTRNFSGNAVTYTTQLSGTITGRVNATPPTLTWTTTSQGVIGGLQVANYSNGSQLLPQGLGEFAGAAYSNTSAPFDPYTPGGTSTYVCSSTTLVISTLLQDGNATSDSFARV